MVLFGDIKLTQCCKDVNVTNTRDTRAARPVLHCTILYRCTVYRCTARRGLAHPARSGGPRQD